MELNLFNELCVKSISNKLEGNCSFPQVLPRRISVAYIVPLGSGHFVA